MRDKARAFAKFAEKYSGKKRPRPRAVLRTVPEV